jgi:Flp pilus assembly protein TadG
MPLHNCEHGRAGLRSGQILAAMAAIQARQQFRGRRRRAAGDRRAGAKTMLKKIKRVLSDEDAAALAEFTLVTPVFVLVALAIVQLGYILFLENNMQAAAQSAAQRIAAGEVVAQGSHVDCAGGVATGAEQLVCDGLSAFTGNFTVSATGSAEAAQDVIVTVSLPMQDAAIVDVLGVLGKGEITTAAVLSVN